MAAHCIHLSTDLRIPIDMAKAAAAKTPDLPASYELALEELEQLVARIESGSLPLEDMLGAYQRGAQLLTFCRSKLEAVENQVRLLDGSPVNVEAQA